MSITKSSKHKLALAVTMALGCGVMNIAFAEQTATEFNAPITGDVTADEAYAGIAKEYSSTSNIYTFTKDSVITVDDTKTTPFTISDSTGKEYNVSAAIANNPTSGYYIYVVAPDNKLTLNVKAGGDNVAAGLLQTSASRALNIGNNSYGLVNGIDINVSASQDSTQKSYGVWRAVTDTAQKGVSFYLADAMNINVDNPNGAYGIAVSTPEGGAENVVYNASSVSVNGDVNIKVSGNEKAESVADNSAGLYVGINNGKIYVYGKANIESAGNGLAIVPTSSVSSYSAQLIRVSKGGKIAITPAEDGSERYAIYNEYGSVQYGAGTQSGLNSKSGAVVMGTGQQIDGDVYIGDNSKNILYLGLSGDDAYMNGVIKEAGSFSNVTLILNDGAVWNNTAFNSSNKGTNTTLKYISGVNGLLHQSADSGNVTIQNLDSHMLKIAYEHDKSDPSKILGGDVIIEKASEDSAINVYTDYDDSLSTEANREAALNGLANKIYYSAYTEGEDNVTGTVSIAEGLTSRSITKYFADMSFDATTGQGYLAKDSTINEYVKPEGQSTAEFTQHIVGDPSKTTDYTEAGVYQNGKYVFTQDTKIDVDPNSDNVVAGPWLTTFQSGIFSGYNEENVSVDLNGHALDLNIENKGSVTGIAGVGPTGKVEIFNAGPMSVNAVSTSGGQTAALFVNGGGQLYIHNGGDNLESKVLTLRGSTKNSTNGAVVKSMNGAAGERSWLKIDGLIDLEADTTNGVGMAEGISAVASTIDVGGGRVIMTASGENPGVNFGGGAANNAIRAYGEFVSSNYGIVNVNVIKDADTATGNAIAAGNNLVQISGNFSTVGGMGSKGKINVGLNTKDSYWVGNYNYGSGWGVTPGDYGSLTLFMGNQAKWMGYSKYSTTLIMDSGAEWEGYSLDNAVAATIKNGAIWHNYNDSDRETTLKSLTGGDSAASAGYIDMTRADKKTTINDYAGYMNVFYAHDAEDPTNITGADITINHAAEDASITLITDNSGFDVHQAEQTTSVLTNLAKKLYYNGAVGGEEDNLNGYVEIAEGLTASSAGLKLADVTFSEEDGQASLLADTIRTPESKIIYGSNETAMMKGAKSAMASSALMWRAENNDLMKRMGDLRLDGGEAGIWAKYYGGKYEMDSQNTNLNLKYNAYQVGFDKEVGNNWKVGIAVSHNDGDSSFGNGTADLTATSIGLYGTWNGDDGQYVDLIAKYTHMEDEFDVYNTYGHKLKGDYKTWGTSISAEYGKRFESKNGFYFDPSVELTLGRINSKDYNASSDYLDTWGKNKNMQVQQDAFNTLVGRLGFRLGQKLDNASYFVKLAAAHEFMGEFDSTFRADGEPEGKTSIDFGDTWYEAQIGGSAKLSDNSMIYASFERSFGGDVDEKWRVDAGLRFTF